MNNKERIYYVIDGSHYVGKPVNISGVVIQAESLEELQRKGKTMCLMMISHLRSVLEQDEPFDIREEHDPDVWLHGEEVTRLKRELEKYKNLFGEI